MPRELPTASLSLHPEAAKVPEMSELQYRAFLADVKERGVQKPIELIPGTRTVIDGRTRLKAATEAGLASVPVVDAELGIDTPVIYMMRVAVLRRQLTSSQAAALAVEIEAELAKAAKERQREGASRGGRKNPHWDHRDKVPEIVPEPSRKPKDGAGEARTQAAKIANTNPRYVSDAKGVKAKAPELFEDVKAGKVTLPAAVAKVKEQQQEAPKPKLPAAGPGYHLAELPIVGSGGLLPTEKAGVGSNSIHPLAPCPFCGSPDVMMVFGFAPKANAKTPIEYVRCKGCGSTGPKAGDKATADQVRAAWNKRVAHNPEAELAAKMDKEKEAAEERSKAAQAGNLDGKYHPAINWNRDAQPAKKPTAEKFPGWVVTYVPKGKNYEERTCHYRGTEAAVRRKVTKDLKAVKIIQMVGLTDKQYTASYGRGKS